MQDADRSPPKSSFALSWSPKRPGRARSAKIPQRVAHVLLICIILLLIFGWGPNLWLVVLSVSALAIGTLALWRNGETGLLLYCFGFQWLQASIGIFWANANGVNLANPANFLGVEQVFLNGADIQKGTELSLIGIFVLFISLSLSAGRPPKRLIETANAQAPQISKSRLIWLYVLVVALHTILTVIARSAGGLSQLVLALSHLKIVGVLIIFHVCLVNGRPYRSVLATIFLAEFILGLGGYFSSFSEVFVLLFISAVAIVKNVSKKSIILGLFAFALAAFIGSVWSNIKPDYRAYLNQGTGQQLVLVGWRDRIAKLGDLALKTDADALVNGSAALARRVSYVTFFGNTLQFVPRNSPHTYGALWSQAIAHPFMPRILFPDKAALDESTVTRRYTGLSVAGAEQGTSISLGYLAETYVDFGEFGMMACLAVFGIILGRIYRKILTLRRFYGLISLYMPAIAFLAIADLGTALSKTVGGIALAIVVITAANYILAKPIKNVVLGKTRRRQSVP